MNTVEVSRHYDFIVIGSGFGGSVSALRLAEKGYSVLVMEKGKRFGPRDFPKSNWNLRRWLWWPKVGFRGLLELTFFRHVTVLSGVGVGGGSLVYANTLPIPGESFFSAPRWGSLANWKAELLPHYRTAQKMLGATPNPQQTDSDHVLKEIANDLGKASDYDVTEVGVYFGDPAEPSPDPYFGGDGPARSGCNFCGGCMLGCRYDAKNTLDKNYLYLAERLGVEIMADTVVEAVRPRRRGGYRIEAQTQLSQWTRTPVTVGADRIVFAGGVLGTVDLLLRMRDDPHGLPRLSARIGDFVRTNSESLIGVVTSRRDLELSEGVAITSILRTDAHSHVEPVRYPRGSGFFRLLCVPHAPGRTLFARLSAAVRAFMDQPRRWLRAFFTWDFARRSVILLHMRAQRGSLSFRLRRSLWRGFKRTLTSQLDEGAPPSSRSELATDLANRYAEKVDGVTVALLPELLTDAPTTAHILGGCCMGETFEDGVIDSKHRVFGYDGLYVIDGSAISANPGVNPSLTITAMAERAMSFIPTRKHRPG